MAEDRPSPGLEELRAARRSGRLLIVFPFIFSIFVNLLMLTGPLFMLHVYDRVLASRSEETLLTLFLLVAFLYAVMGLLDYLRGRILARLGARFQTALDRRVFDAEISRSILPAARGAPASGLQDLDALQRLLSSPAMLAVFDVPWTPLYLGAIFLFHPSLGWLGLSGAALLIALTALNQALTRAAAQRGQARQADAQTLADAARLSGEVMRAQGMDRHSAARWAALRQRALGQSIDAADWAGVFTALAKAFRLFLQSAMLALGAWLVLRDQMTAGAMIAASILLGRGLAPVEQALVHWPTLQRARSAWRSLSAFLEATPPEPVRTPLPPPSAKLAVSRLAVVPPGGTSPVLRNVSFELNPGEALAVIGRSGAGKSSLARALTGVWPPASGGIRLDGAALDHYGSEALSRAIGYLPQEVTLFPGTVAENIARMSPSPDADAVIRAARAAGVHDLVAALPQGYDTALTGTGPQLSGGQRQRIGLARALYGQPVLLILDEPNAALDAEGTDALTDAVSAFKAAGGAVLIMTHRPTAISACNRLLVLDQGRMTACGPREEVLRSMVQNAQDVQRLAAGGRG